MKGADFWFRINKASSKHLWAIGFKYQKRRYSERCSNRWNHTFGKWNGIHCWWIQIPSAKPTKYWKWASACHHQRKRHLYWKLLRICHAMRFGSYKWKNVWKELVIKHAIYRSACVRAERWMNGFEQELGRRSSEDRTCDQENGTNNYLRKRELLFGKGGS